MGEWCQYIFGTRNTESRQSIDLSRCDAAVLAHASPTPRVRLASGPTPSRLNEVRSFDDSESTDWRVWAKYDYRHGCGDAA